MQANSRMKFKLTTVDGRDEQFDIRLTLGDGKVLKRDFGLQDLGKINMADPDILCFLLERNYHREHPEATPEEVKNHVESLDFFSFEDLNKKDETDPTPAGTGSPVASASNTTDGAPATTLESSGVPS